MHGFFKKFKYVESDSYKELVFYEVSRFSYDTFKLILLTLFTFNCIILFSYKVST